MKIASLFAHLKDLLVDTSLVLQPPATDEDIRKAEEIMDVNFPSDLVELYKCANGEAHSYLPELPAPFGLFGQIPFASLDIVLKKHREYNEHLQTLESVRQLRSIPSQYFSLPAGAVKADFFNRNWIPFAISDDNPVYLGVDLDPDSGGLRNQIVMFGPDAKPNVYQAFDSIESMLVELLENYKNMSGHPHFGNEDDNLISNIEEKYSPE